MSSEYILSCESTVDMPYSYVSGRGIPVLFYSYMIDGVEYQDDMCRDPNALDEFYAKLNSGKLPSTSQINQYDYEAFFDALLEKGDVLHIVFGSGMTKSILNAQLAAENVRQRHPGRKLILVDSLCSSSGYGLLVDEAADRRDNGWGIEELERWLINSRLKVHHQFFSTDLSFFRRSGRVSGPVAMIGAMLNICPIMCLDDEGKIIAYSKVRGKLNAIKYTVNVMEEKALGSSEYAGKCFIAHSRCLEAAERTRELVQSRFSKLKDIRIFDIGTIIASHSGPGTVAVFFMGNDRVKMD